MTLGRIFISHKNTPESNEVGGVIRETLDEADYHVFFDKDFLEGGMNWKETIWEELRQSDVLLLVLDENTFESDWVQREADVAMALRVSILPVAIGFSIEKVRKALERFDIEEIQALQFKGITPSNVEKSLNSILEALPKCIAETEMKQKAFYRQGIARHKKPLRIENHAQFARYRLKDNPDICEFVIVTGDATQTKGYDIIVNTENDYMQMARFFEMNTVSAIVRWKGAEFTPGNNLKQDTIQLQLNEQLFHMGLHQLPVGDGAVIPTFAGNENSQLRQTGFRYILHAAAVKIHRTSRQIQSLDASANPDIVMECFDRAQKIHEDNGSILYKDGVIMTSASDKADINSILFTVFGAGKGGNSLEDATEGIILGFKRYFKTRDEHTINKVGLCIYNLNDVDMVMANFDELGFERID